MTTERTNTPCWLAALADEQIGLSFHKSSNVWRRETGQNTFQRHTRRRHYSDKRWRRNTLRSAAAQLQSYGRQLLDHHSQSGWWNQFKAKIFCFTRNALPNAVRPGSANRSGRMRRTKSGPIRVLRHSKHQQPKGVSMPSLLIIDRLLNELTNCWSRLIIRVSSPGRLYTV